jgi:hypothetical protein
MYYAQGERIEGAADDAAIIDPFHAYYHEAGKPVLPKTISKDRAAWRDAESLFTSAVQEAEKKRGMIERQTSAALSFFRVVRERENNPLPRVLPVLVAGFAIPGGQPPPDLWCAEEFRLPAAILDEEGEGVRRLGEAIQKAKDGAVVLRSAVHYYASEFLKHDNGSFDKKAASEFADAICREGDYWAALEAPFHELLPSLGMENWNQVDWEARVCSAACEAFDASLVSLNTSGRHLRALNSASGWFFGAPKGIKSLKSEMEVESGNRN